MIRTTRGVLTLVLMLIAAACGGAATSSGSVQEGTSGRVRSRFDLITVEEIRQRGQFSNLYELVQNLRPRWLRAQGPDSFSSPGKVQVHMDGNRLGAVEALRNLAASGVTSLQWVAPIDAAARYGLDHGHGVILVSTAPAH